VATVAVLYGSTYCPALPAVGPSDGERTSEPEKLSAVGGCLTVGGIRRGAAMHGEGKSAQIHFFFKNAYYSNNLLEWIPMAHIDARDLPAPFVHGCLIVWYT
jgi:hypothetical protein